MILGLVNSDGRWSSEDDKMETIAIEYFQELFTSSNPPPDEISKIFDSI